MIERAIPMYIAPNSVLYPSVVSSCTSIGRVYIDRSLIRISGSKKLFHDPINPKIAIVANAGLINGRMIVWKILSSLAPSIRAESTNAG